MADESSATAGFHGPCRQGTTARTGLPPRAAVAVTGFESRVVHSRNTVTKRSEINMRYSAAKQAALELADGPKPSRLGNRADVVEIEGTKAGSNVVVTKTPFGFVTDAGEAKGTQSGFGLAMLRGLGTPVGHLGRDRHVYGGTVSPATVAKRRTANRVARKSRRANRR